MTRTRYRSVIAHLLILAALVVPSAPFAIAAEATSSAFKTRDTLLNDFGGYGTSSSFSNVESGGHTVGGEATSTSFLLDAGPLYFDTFTPKSRNWRWYGDESNETPSDALAAENVAPSSIVASDIVKLRMTIVETAGFSGGNTKFKLQYSTSSDFSTGAVDVSEEWACGVNSAWCYADGGGTDNAVITTGVLTDADSCVASVGDGCGMHNESGTSTSAFTHLAGAATEYEFTVEQHAAVPNTVYFFRAFYVPSGDAVPYDTGESYPSISAQGTTLTFSIDGLPAATTTEGVTTDVDATATSVPFGTMLLDSAVEAGHRLIVSTNASAGYRIFAFERQGFLQDGGADIPPVTGTNDTPAAWNTGCDSGAPGCWGYHSGEDVLAGGSARFAPNDTYAQFSASPNEVAYASGPVTDRATDVVYRLIVRDQQDAGEYSSSLVYIVTPVF